MTGLSKNIISSVTLSFLVLPHQMYFKAEKIFNGAGLGESIRMSIIATVVLISYIAEKSIGWKNNYEVLNLERMDSFT